MPVVVSSSGPSVASAPLVPVRTAPEDFGGGAAARPLDTSGLQDFAQREVEKHDQIAVLAADNRLDDAQQAIIAKGRQLRGQNALGATAAAQPEWASTIDDVRQTLNERQTRAFDRLATSRWYDIHHTLEAHASAELSAFTEETAKSALQKRFDAAITNFADPTLRAKAFDELTAIVHDQGRWKGQSEETTAQAAAELASKAHLGVIESMLNAKPENGGGDLVASQYLQEHRGELLGPDVARADKLTNAGSTLGQAQRASDAIAGKFSTLTAGMTEAAKISDPEVREETSRLLRQHFIDQSSDIREQRQQAFQGASALVEKTGSFESVPLSMRIQLTPEENGALQHRANQIRNPERTTNRDLFLSLINSAGISEASRQWFLDTDLGQYRDKLSEEDFNHVVGLQLQGRQGRVSAEANEGRREAGIVEKQRQKQLLHDQAIQQLRALGVHIPETPGVPGAPIKRPDAPAPTGPTKDPGGDVDLGRQPAPAASAAPVTPPPGAPQRVPQSWLDHAARDDNYKRYLQHMGVQVP